MEGKFTLHLHGAEQLLNRDVVGKQDPYCIAQVGSEKFSTKVIERGGTEAEWDEAFIFNLDGKGDQVLHLIVKDKDQFVDDSIGKYDVKLSELLRKDTKQQIRLVGTDNQHICAGILTLTATFEGTGGPTVVKDDVSVEMGSMPLLDEKDRKNDINKRCGNLIITCHQADDLVKKDLVTKNDPYVDIQIGIRGAQTPVHQSAGANAVWEHKMSFQLRGNEDLVHCKVKDKDRYSDDTIGRFDIAVATFLTWSGKGKQKFNLMSPNNFHKINGNITLTIQFIETGTEEYVAYSNRSLSPEEKKEMGISPGSVALSRMTSAAADTSDKFDWDWALFFRIGQEKVTVKGISQVEHFRKQAGAVVDKLLDAGLKILLYKAQSGEHIICLVAASEERLMREAYRAQYDLELDRDEIYGQGKEVGMNLCTHIDNKEPKFTKEMFESVFGPYKPHDPKVPTRKNIYRRYQNEGVDVPGGSLFRTTDRLKLTQAIIEAEPRAKGAGLRLNRMLASGKHPLVAFFPLHKEIPKHEIKSEWLKWGSLFRQPVQKIRHYFGESIGFYFGFLQFYSRWLVLPALFGTIAFLWQAATQNVEVPLFAFVGVIMALWTTAFLEFWKRRQATLASMWGMTYFEDKEQPRPEFRGAWVKSQVDGSPVEYYPFLKRLLRAIISQAVIMTLIGIVVACVTGIFFLRAAIKNMSNPEVGGYIVSVVNALQIMLLNLIYSNVAHFLNDFENHRTESEYMNGLILKTFLFKFVNSYNTLFYIAFFKQYDIGVEGCPSNNCLPELRKQLATIFITQIIVSNVVEYIKPVFAKFNNERKGKKHVDSEDSQDVSPPEKEFELNIYASTFDDFDEIVIQYGYTTLFVTAFPITPLLALIGNFVEIRLDAAKLCRYSRRPYPTGTSTIGKWFDILSIMSFIAVVTNIAVIVFATAADTNNTKGKKFLNFDLVGKFIFFIITEHILILFKFVIAFLVPDVPGEIRTHLARQDYICRALIDGVQENEQELAELYADEIKEPTEEERNRILRIYDFDRIPNKIPPSVLAKWKRNPDEQPVQLTSLTNGGTSSAHSSEINVK